MEATALLPMFVNVPRDGQVMIAKLLSVHSWLIRLHEFNLTLFTRIISLHLKTIPALLKPFTTSTDGKDSNIPGATAQCQIFVHACAKLHTAERRAISTASTVMDLGKTL
jgi:hypothetical protein